MSNTNEKWVMIENRLTSLEVTVADLANNHLPHIAQDIKELHSKIDKGIWLAMTTFLGILIDLVLKFIK